MQNTPRCQKVRVWTGIFYWASETIFPKHWDQKSVDMKKRKKEKKRFWQNWKKNKLKGWPCSEFSANGVIMIVEDFPLKQIQVHCRIPHGILNVPWQFSSILVDEGIVKVKNLLITLKSSYRHHKLLQTKQNTALPFQTMV